MRPSGIVALRLLSGPPVDPDDHREPMNTRKYEAIYIVDSKLDDGAVNQIANRFKGVVESQGGTVESAGKWEKRKLAYEVDGHRDGNYVLMQFEASSKVPQELSRQMRISDDIIRHRIYLMED